MSPAASMMHLAVLTLSLVTVTHMAPPTASVDLDSNQTIEVNLDQGHATLNDVFREVEKLMEDTQHTLEETVFQMYNESAKSIQHLNNLPSDYHNVSRSERKVGNKTIYTVEKIDTVTDNKTGATHFSRTLIQSSGQENGISQECMVDEDCRAEHYCLYQMLQSKCLPCKLVHVPCMKDAECCSDQLCIWGKCMGNATKGEAGSICQFQSDCRTELCCAFHKALLFPVCTARPLEQEPCHSQPNQLMQLLSWDTQGEGPLEHCPCMEALQCQSLGRGSLCLRQQNSSSEEDLTETLYSEIDYII